MWSSANHGATKVYALLSTFEQTFVLHYNNDTDILLISPKLSRKDLLKAIFLVLALNLRKTFEKTNPELFKILNDITEDVDKYVKRQKDTLNPPHNYNLRKREFNEWEQTQSQQNRKINSKNQLGYELLISFRKNRISLGYGRTSMVFKVHVDGVWLAFKMVDLFKPAVGALQELENEAKVMNWLTKKKKCKTLIKQIIYKIRILF